jgi:hypothetical protein
MARDVIVRTAAIQLNCLIVRPALYSFFQLDTLRREHTHR